MISSEYAKILLAMSVFWYDGESQLTPCLKPTWHPLRYNIRLYPDMESNDFNGAVTIQGVTTQTTNVLDLNSEDLVVKSVSLNDRETVTDFKQGNTTLTLRLPRSLSEGTAFNLTIAYVGLVNAGETGIFATSYQAKDGSTKKVLATSFQPNGARQAFPCLDEPKYKAIFELNLAVRSDLTALSNMPSRPREKSERSATQYEWVEFEPTPKMSTYLLAFIVGEFNVVHLRKNTNIWIPTDERDRAVTLHLDFLSEALDVLESYTGIAFPMPKLDHIISVGVKSYGAMENWGLITYSPTSLITENSTKSIENEEIIRTSTIHEIIHQWVGNLVTCEHWGYTWLNEGVTSFLVPIIWRQMSSKESDAENYHTAAVRSAMLAEIRYPNTLRRPEICSTNEVVERFNEVTYYKGAAVLRMLDDVITDNCFQIGLRKYLKENQYGSANESQLWDSIEDTCTFKFLPRHITLETVMSTWSGNPGFPILVVHRDESSGRISVSQVMGRLPEDREEKVNISIAQSTKDPSLWWIPLSYTTSQERNFKNTRAKDWLEPNNSTKELTVTLSNEDWIIFNLKLTAFYRVQYDPVTWAKLSAYLANGHFHEIHPVNRANLLDDAFNLLLIGRLDFSTVFNLTRYLVRENDSSVWKSASQGLTLLKLRWPTDYDLLKRYIVLLVDPVYKAVTDNNYRAVTIPQRSLSSTIIELACEVGHPDCMRLAVQTVKGVINGTVKESEMPPGRLRTFWCSALSLSPDSRKLWRYWKEANQRTTIFKDDTFWQCLTNDDLIKEILEDALNNATYIRSSVFDILNYFYTLKTCPVIEFLDENYDAFTQRFNAEIIQTFCLNDIFDSYVIQGCEDKAKGFFQRRFNSSPNIEKNEPNKNLRQVIKYEIERLKEFVLI